MIDRLHNITIERYNEDISMHRLNLKNHLLLLLIKDYMASK